ncbi:hypothetical protein PFISCL1PPCAC_11637, partial [Pristionchus fissidentatus]
KCISRPAINYGVNMSSSQFVVGVGIFMNFPMDFSYGPYCTGVIISKRHVITADHCLHDLYHDPSRLYVAHGSNCFNPVFSRHNHTTHYTDDHV